MPPGGESGRVPLDTGWAWVCAFAASMMNILVYGGYRSFGVLFVEIIEVFGASPGLTALVAGLIMLFNTVTPPITGALVARVGSRPLVVCGGILIATGSIVSSLCTSVYQLIFVYGICTGIGYGCCYTPGMAILGRYFRRRFAMANGIASSGVCLGQLLLPLLIRLLLDNYGFRGTMLICGSLALHICVAGSLMTPHTFYTKVKSRSQKKGRDVESLIISEKCVSFPIETEDKPEQKQTIHKAADRNSLDLSLNDKGYLSKNGFSSTGSMCFYTSLENVQTDEGPDTHTEPQLQKSQRNVCHKFVNIFNLSLFKINRFKVILLALVTGNIGCMSIVVIIPPHVRDIGISKMDAAAMVSVTGACELVSRLSCGTIADNAYVRRYVKGHHIMMASYFTIAAVNFLFALFTERASVYAACAMFGLASGGYNSMFPVVIKECVGVPNYASALGFTMCSFGLGNSIAPTVMGWLRDVTGSYVPCFLLGGSASAFGTLVLIVGYLITRNDREVSLQADPTS